MRDSAPSSDRPGHDDVAAGLLDRRRCLGRLATLALVGGAVPAHAARRRPDSAAVSLLGPVDLLPAPLRQMLEASGLPLESFGLHMQPLDGGAAVLSWQAGRAFVLASTSKLLTSMAALDLLGPGYRWRTRAYLSGPLTQGRLLGDLVIRGGGDAMLTSADLLQWFREIQAQGLREVWGDIVINREAFRLRPEDLTTTPEPTPERPHHVRPDALALDAGVVRVALRSDAGGRTDIEITPPLHDVRLVNSLGHGGGCAASAVLRDAGSQLQPQLQVSGQWSPRCGAQQIRFAPVGVRDLGVRAIEGLWLQAGGVLRGRVVEHDGGTPTPWRATEAGGGAAPFAEHLSAPLSEQLREMNKRSDNLIARHLMLSLAPDFPDRSATAEAARLRMREWLRRRGGLRDETVGLDTGSGLSRLERATPQAFVHLLQRAARGPHWKLLQRSLPVAGVDGTLEGRLRGSAAQGRAWLKTGTLLDTRGLAGCVQTRGGRMMAVTLLAHHPDQNLIAAAVPVLDACIDWAAHLA
ncbi:MAG: D-alanyl-D-alanine carboxypeptidase/D-alanyl-D-alanine-endopeptidase [Pseudomonadota bacterium]|jgi:D-alanyl-D-alanine carboxypeptidase/D-alanyl-D-alanine-endopeptidase (penicillin-binding protein 4)